VCVCYKAQARLRSSNHCPFGAVILDRLSTETKLSGSTAKWSGIADAPGAWRPHYFLEIDYLTKPTPVYEPLAESCVCSLLL
jgi:hypothetical protein